jgi:hypothetical protein
MKCLLPIILLLLCLGSSAQITFTASLYTPSPDGTPDFNLPQGRGTATWLAEGPTNNGFGIPKSNSTYADIRDRYSRWAMCNLSNNNSTNVYQFNLAVGGINNPDEDFNAAIDAGGKMAIGVHFQCGFCQNQTNQFTPGGQSFSVVDPANGQTGFGIYPQWWHTAMQGDAVKDFTWQNAGNWEWFPNVNGNTFRSLWRGAHTAWLNHVMTTSHFSVRLNRNVFYYEVVDYIEVSGYGQTGEWTLTPYMGNTGNAGTWPGPAGTQPTPASLDSIISIVADVWKDFRVVYQYATLDANYQSNNTNNPPEPGWYALQRKTNKGYLGWRRESWGLDENNQPYVYHWANGINSSNVGVSFTVPSGYPQAGQSFKFDTAQQNRWKIAPVVGEACCSLDATMALIPGQVPTYHLRGIDNGNTFDFQIANGNPGGYEPNLRKACAASGYHIGFTSGGASGPVAPGGTFTVTVGWQNNGVAPPYDDWVSRYQLRNSSGTVVWQGDGVFNLIYLLPGSVQTKTENFVATFGGNPVPAGTYQLWMAVVDPTVPTYKPNMDLYITKTPDANKFYQLATNFVISGSLPNGPTAVITGPNNVVLPTTSVTLSGTSSTDVGSTITGYLWSYVSGPVGSTIGTPTASTSTITGLVAGNYVFSLKVTDGNALTNTVQYAVAVTAGVTNVGIFPSNSFPASTTSNDTPSPNTAGGQATGVRFVSTVAGYVKGIRYYKTAGRTGTNTGQLYTNNGVTLLGSVVFTGESATGWQQMLFTTPVPVQANTQYLASVFNSAGNYVEDNDFYLNHSVTNGTMTAIADGCNGCSSQPDLTFNTNGPWGYMATAGAPLNAFRSANYWDDIVFSVNTPPTAVITASATSITLPTNSVVLNSATSTDPEGNGTITGHAWAQVSGPNTASNSTPTGSTTTFGALIQGTYVFQLTVTDELGAQGSTTQSIVVNAAPDGTIFQNTAPGVGTSNDGTGAIETGVKFRSAVNGFVTAIRFYKTAGNTGTHTAQLFDNTGALLSQVNFGTESATGWQTVNLPTAIAVTANTTYIAAYWSSAGTYVGTINGLATAVVNGNVTALADGTDGVNGLFRYTATPAVPNSGATQTNYWVDVQFQATQPPLANAGTNQTITLPLSTVTLNGSGSVSATSYVWSQVSGPNTATISTPTAVTTSASGLVAGTYVFQLSINSGASTSQVTITVNPIPPPTANAGPPQTIALPTTTVSLSGAASVGTISSYTWTKVSGPGTQVITTPTQVNTTVTGLSTVGTYVFNLSLNGGVSNSTVTITVINTQPNPTILIHQHHTKKVNIK